MPSQKESVMATTETTRHPQVFMRPGEVFNEPPPLYLVNNLLDRNFPKPNYQTPKPQIHHHGTYSPSRVKTPAPNPTVGPKLPFEQPEVISRTRFLTWRQKANQAQHPKKLSPHPPHPPLQDPVSVHPMHPIEGSYLRITLDTSSILFYNITVILTNLLIDSYSHTTDIQNWSNFVVVTKNSLTSSY